MSKKPLITMSDVMGLLGYSRPSVGRDNMYIPCWNCDTPNTRTPHLNVNFTKNCYRCVRCADNHGGIFSLYSHYTGIAENKARDAIYARLGVNGETAQADVEVWRNYQKEIAELPPECPLADIETRDKTYAALLSRLSLAPDHRKNLKGRGLSDAAIDALGYKTTPYFGTKQIANALLMEGYYLKGVPGFFRDKDGTWNLNLGSWVRGILIPARDENGRIQGLQIRLDKVKKQKFIWLTSVSKQDGCAAETFCHLSGAATQSVLLTEGHMKADIIHYFTGLTVLSVPGVNVLQNLDEMLNNLIQRGLKKGVLAYDMDMGATRS